jgi:hypothetical protein
MLLTIRYILQKYYGIQVSTLRLAAFNKADKAFFTTEIPVIVLNYSIYFLICTTQDYG